MKRLIVIGALAVAAAVPTAPAAQASDDSVRAVVRAQAERQVREDRRFIRNTRSLSTRKGLNKARLAAKRQAASIRTFKAALVPERADTPQVAEGRRELLNALNHYNKGLAKLRQGLRQALNAGGNSGVTKARAGLRNMRTAARRAGQAARKIL
jgi:hypothetical protein